MIIIRHLVHFHQQLYDVLIKRDSKQCVVIAATTANPCDAALLVSNDEKYIHL